MDLEQLTKHQILLLTLLVSFVTSIATGIVTVSLMDQAPEGVTRVINQIVERTVETVVPDTQGAATATTEKTVVIQQDELVPQSIATVQKSVIRIVREGEGEVLARGVILDARGLAVTDRAALAAAENRNLEAILYSGERVALTVRDDNAATAAVFIDVNVGTSTGFVQATLTDPAKLTLGQTVLRISGSGSDTVSQGVIAALPAAEGDRQVVEASVASATPGSVLLTIFGEVVGIATPSLSPNNDSYTIITMPSAPATVINTVSSS